MFDFRVSKHSHFDEACSCFAKKHNLVNLAKQAGMNVQTLRNKLNPAQPHQLTAPEIWLLTDLTEDASLVDGFLAQIHCLPCVPVNELAREKLSLYVMQATAQVGQVAANAATTGRITHLSRRSIVESANAGMRFLALSALAVDARLKSSPSMSSAVDTMTGIGASFGLI
ncbi:phage regulatory CII family protein [Atlantibacter hermannii]|uniref:phage regulatory CII family protein n=1 Tax=Atlantibacter hermannii TaxID=565 RepID=UPI003075F00B